jgi:hypothetical protein
MIFNVLVSAENLVYGIEDDFVNHGRDCGLWNLDGSSLQRMAEKHDF